MKTQMSDWGSSRPRPSSGDGDGCLMTVVAGVAAALILTTVGILVADSAEAVVPRKPTCTPTAMPNVVGMWLDEASPILTDKGFGVHANRVKGELDRLHVESTYPVAGEIVSRCITVEIWLGR